MVDVSELKQGKVYRFSKGEYLYVYASMKEEDEEVSLPLKIGDRLLVIESCQRSLSGLYCAKVFGIDREFSGYLYAAGNELFIEITPD